MSADTASYWQPALLTPMGLLQYGVDEVSLYTLPGAPQVDLQLSASTPPPPQHCGGQISVTSHRIVWTKENKGGSAAATSSTASSAPSSSAPSSSLYLPLDCIERVELKSSFLGFSTPKLNLHLYDQPTLSYRRQKDAVEAAAAAARLAGQTPALPVLPPAPARSTLPRYTRLTFRGEAPDAFMQHLSAALTTGVFRSSPLRFPSDPSTSSSASSSASTQPPKVGTAFSTSRAGISGIERLVKQRERAIDMTLEQAFKDLDALMSNAKTIVDLSARLSASREVNTDAQSKSEFNNMLTDMGIANPVTRQLAGSDYHMHLSRQLADFLPGPLVQHGGMLLLTDVYCLVNRARGTQLISPQDCLMACQLFEQLQTTLRLKEFESGVKAVVADAHAEESVAERIRDLLEQEEKQLAVSSPSSSSPSSFPPLSFLSPLRLSNLWHISLVLSKHYLLVSEQRGVLVRDEAPHGLQFTLNRFDQWMTDTRMAS